MSSVEITKKSNKTVVVGGGATKQTVEVHDPGVAGPPNTLAIGTVTSGVAPTVTITGTAPSQTLNFTLPMAGAYTYTQSSPSTTWTINHNLGFRPAVTVVDSGGTTVVGDVTYVSENSLSISFSSSFGGVAYLS